MDCSKRPAIGYNFFEENYQQMIDSGQQIPRYYLKCFLDPKKSVYNPELFEKYENERMFKFINRSSHEIYAKYIIDHQKINMKTTFRERDASLDESDLYYETDLLLNRDNYVAKTRESI